MGARARDLSSLPARIGAAWRVAGGTLSAWPAPLATLPLWAALWGAVSLGQTLDWLLLPGLRRARVRDAIVIAGNPRSGTTFLHRFLHDHGIGVGRELWQLLYPSRTLQALLRPALPLLERISPARHHSSVAHETSLRSVETDDVSLFFRHLDGFFLFGFLLAFLPEDAEPAFDPRIRDTSARDFRWLRRTWARNPGDGRVLAKLFSISARMPQFLGEFPDAKILYTVRDPAETIPSTLSLLSSVLDRRFGFWSLAPDIRARYCQRLQRGLITLLRRFDEDRRSGRIPANRVHIVRYERLVGDFEGAMGAILDFVGHRPEPRVIEAIRREAESQRARRSRHAYDAARFGLDPAAIQQECKFLYDSDGLLAN
jgi:hypothetical protein